MIAGHATSVSLEPVFWNALAAAAGEMGVPLSAVVARIDAARVAGERPPNLASAIRVWLFERALGRPVAPAEAGASGDGAVPSPQADPSPSTS